VRVGLDGGEDTREGAIRGKGQLEGRDKGEGFKHKHRIGVEILYVAWSIYIAIRVCMFCTYCTVLCATSVFTEVTFWLSAEDGMSYGSDFSSAEIAKLRTV
jgi:hypothetical protein